MVQGKLPMPWRPTIWTTEGQGPTALAVGAGGCWLDIFTLIYPFFPLSPSLWETARYRLKYCRKGPLNPLPTNQPTVNLDPFTGVKINHCSIICMTNALRGWSGGAMVLGKLPVPGRPTIWITVGQGPTALTVGAGGGCYGHFYSPLSFLSSFSLSLGDGPI